jgi:hypothetical protein
MKPLDKAYLIQELAELIEKLKTGHLSYFEHARSKQRIMEIKKICEHSFSQNLSKHCDSAIKPMLYAQDFVHQCLYRDFCCGIFQDDQALEQSLYAKEQSSWGLLYDANLGWQIWLLQMPHQTLLISDHDDLEAAYSWLLTQQQTYNCFNIDIVTQATIEPILTETVAESTQAQKAEVQNLDEVSQFEQFSPLETIEKQDEQRAVKRTSSLQPISANQNIAQSLIENYTPASLRISRKQEADISEGLEFNLGIEPLHPNKENSATAPDIQIPVPVAEEITTPPTIAEQSTEKPDLNIVDHLSHIEYLSSIDPVAELGQAVSTDVNKTLEQTAEQEQQPNSIFLSEHICHIIEISDTTARDKQLCRLLPQYIQCDYADLVLYQAGQDYLFKRPVYIAEQINKQNSFVKYLVLFGVENNLTALRLAHVYTHTQDYKLAALGSIDWPNLEQNLFELETLFNTYHALSTSIWSLQQHYPFIPKNLLHSQKFIQFDETAATLQTPLLLLKERQKIRVIHGQNRLNLNHNESAYPYLLLDRQQGISWQLIQDVIQSLSQPIDPVQLHQRILQHIA